MRFAKTIGGLLLLLVAAWMIFPAAIEARALVSLPADSPKQPAQELAIGKFSLRGWSFVLMTGIVGIALVPIGLHLLVSRNAES